MKIIKEILTLDELKKMASAMFGNMVKTVVDIEQEFVALDAELSSDLEALLLENGSKQKNLWGINLYPEMQGDDFWECDSMINTRPSQGNKSRGVDREEIHRKIVEVAVKRIKP